MVRLLIVTSVMLLAWTPVLAADTILLGHDETRVEREPDVAMDDAGGMVVVWSSQVPGGAQPLDCIRLRRIDPEGSVVGEEFRIDPLPGDLARNPSVDITPDGSRFVIAWEGGEQGHRLKRRIWARVFGADGKPIGGEIRVEQSRLTHEHHGLPREAYGGPRVSVAPTGEFVVTWRTEANTSCDRFNISARRFSAKGKPLGDEFIVNTDRSWSQVNPDIDHDGLGGFLIVWQEGRWIGTLEEWSAIRGRRFGHDGETVGEELLLSQVFDWPAAVAPSVDVSTDGSFVCAWREGAALGPATRIHAANFDPEGTLIAEPITVDVPFESWMQPKVAFVAEGRFMVAWVDRTEDPFGSFYVAAQGFAVDGAPITWPIPISPLTCASISQPVVAMSSSGVGGVAWRTPVHNGVDALRYSLKAPSESLPVTGEATTLSDLITEWRQDVGNHRVELADRTSAVRKLSCRRGASRIALDDLKTCLVEEEDPALRAECAKGAAAVAQKAEQVLPKLRTRLISDESPRAQAAAAHAIGLLGSQALSAERLLAFVLESEDPELRGEAALALGRIGAVSSIDAIVDASADERIPYARPLAIQGLGHLADHEAALTGGRRLIESCFDRSVKPGDLILHRRSIAEIEREFSNEAARNGVTDRDRVKRVLPHLRYRIENDRIGVFETPDEIAFRSFYKRIDEELSKILWGGSPKSYRGCECLAGGARRLALVRPFEKVGGLFSDAIKIGRAKQCGFDPFPMIAALGSEASTLSGTLREILAVDLVTRADVVRALAAVDPASEESVRVFGRLLASPRTEIQKEAIEGLAAAGPWAVLGNRERLNVLLERGDQKVWRPVEDALAIAEADTAACKKTWAPPVPDATPPPNGADRVPAGRSAMPPRPVRTLPPGSAMPPRAVRTPPAESALPANAIGTPPVAGSGYTGKPKKPD